MAIDSTDLKELYSKLNDERMTNIRNTDVYNVIFMVNDNEYQCIWQLFALQSPYFEDFIQLTKINEVINDEKKDDDIKDDDNILQIQLKQMDDEVFKIIHEFSYGFTPKIDLKQAVKVLYLTDPERFSVPALYDACHNFLKNVLDECISTDGLRQWCHIVQTASEVNNDWCKNEMRDFVDILYSKYFTIHYQYVLLKHDELYALNKSLFERILFKHNIFL